MSASAFPLYTGLVSAAGQSAAFDIRTNTTGWVTVDCTAGAGSPVFDCWLEGSNDEGVTWEEILHNGAMKNTATSTSPTVVTGRNIVTNKASTTPEKFSARYDFLPMKKIRLAWILTGTSTPSVTFTARFGGK